MKENNFVINFIDLVHWQQLIGKTETQFSLGYNEILICISSQCIAVSSNELKFFFFHCGLL